MVKWVAYHGNIAETHPWCCCTCGFRVLAIVNACDSFRTVVYIVGHIRLQSNMLVCCLPPSVMSALWRSLLPHIHLPIANRSSLSY